jgi:P-type E1-E2 ATPase
MAFGLLVYVAFLPQLLSLDIDLINVVFTLCNFITYCYPAPFPIFFNLAYSFCLVRLNKENIIGTQAEKTVESSRMKTICFDKTGTLTQNKMEVANVYAFAKNKIADITTNI